MRSRLFPRVFCSVVVLLAFAVAGQAADLWMHVQVHDGKDGGHVSVNLPVKAISTAVPIIHAQLDKSTRIHVDDKDLSVAQMRAIWQQLKASPDMNFVTVQEPDQRVRVTKSKGYVLIHVNDQSGEKDNVDVRVPVRVVDALLSGNENEIDVAAGLEALASAGEGDLVTVTSSKDHVRVWIDHLPEAK